MDNVSKALDLWLDLVQIDPKADKFTIGDWDTRRMCDQLKEALELEPTGATCLFMLDWFATSYLKNLAFTAHEMMEDLGPVRRTLDISKQLYSLIRDDADLEDVRKQFVSEITKALESYGVSNKTVLELINDRCSLGFLMRDALKSMQALECHQFLQGDPSTEKPTYLKYVYEYWNINSLLKAQCSLPNGISLNLIRDPEKVSCSFFAFCIRNGGTLTVLTDKPCWSHPRQKYMTRSRGECRSYSARVFDNHFPYHILDTSISDDERAVFDHSPKTGLVRYQQQCVPRKSIADLEPDEIIWVTMMFDLIQKKFWKEGYKTPLLSYTGEMVVQNQILAGSPEVSALAVRDYKPIVVDKLSSQDVSTEKMLGEWEIKPTRQNEWMEKRYEKFVRDDLLNLVAHVAEGQFLLVEGSNSPVVTDAQEYDRDQWMATKKREGFEVDALRPTEFGTRESVVSDIRWKARFNKAKQINRAAREEYEATHEAIEQWYRGRIVANKTKLLDAIAVGEMIAPSLVHETFGVKKETTPHNILTVSTPDYYYSQLDTYSHFRFCGNQATWQYDNWYKCWVNNKDASIIVRFNPQTPEALALVCGCEVKDLPEVLQHWRADEQYCGNSILTRIDPMEWVVKNPWEKFRPVVYIYLSKTGFGQIRRDRGLPPAPFWKTDKLFKKEEPVKHPSIYKEDKDGKGQESSSSEVGREAQPNA